MQEKKSSNETKGIFDKTELKFANLEERIEGGLQFANMMCSMNQESIKLNQYLLHTLVEVLISRGYIHLHEIEERRAKIIQSFSQNDEKEPKVHLLDAPDKYSPEVQRTADCENRWPICKGVCCKLWFPLSVQDLDERIVKWNYSRPYGIAQREDGYCVHMDRSSLKCTIYENRPLICRTYDCREDKRIWLDYENKILNPELNLQ